MIFNSHFSFNSRPPSTPVSANYDPYVDLEVSPSSKLPPPALTRDHTSMHASTAFRLPPHGGPHQNGLRITHFDDLSGGEEDSTGRLDGLSVRRAHPISSRSSRQDSITSISLAEAPGKRPKKGPPPPLQLGQSNKAPRTSFSKRKPCLSKPQGPPNHNLSLGTPSCGLLNNAEKVDSKGLQKLAQRLLQGSPSHVEEERLDEGCLRKTSNMPFKASWLNPLRRTTCDTRRLSTISTTSSSSGVPSLVFSEPRQPDRRPSSATVALHIPKPGRKGSCSSTTSRCSNTSWFIAEDSPPSSPDTLKGRIGFRESICLGLSVFDDSDEEDVNVTCHKDELFLKVPDLKPSELGRTQFKQPPAQSSTEFSKSNALGQSVDMGFKKSLPTADCLGTSSTLARSPTTRSQSPVCSAPPRRRSRRRTASSECIVAEALEEMNIALQELAKDDIASKSIMGLDLQGD